VLRWLEYLLLLAFLVHLSCSSWRPVAGVSAISLVLLLMALLLLLASVMSPDNHADVCSLALSFLKLLDKDMLDIAGVLFVDCLPFSGQWPMCYRNFQNVNFSCCQDISLE
jgi:hypothetical protein